MKSSLALTADQLQAAALYFCRCCDTAVQGAQSRDALLIDWDDQLEGRYVTPGTPRWINASEINDPLTREAHIQLLAMIQQAVSKDPKWFVISFDPANDDRARNQEDWLNNKAEEYDLNSVMYAVAFNALRDPVGILFIGWQQKTKRVSVMRYRHPDADDDELPLDRDERLPGQAYEEVETEDEEIEAEGCLFRTPDLADFYLYPANAVEVESSKPGGAQGVYERMLFTQDQLLDGIDTLGYDPDAVDSLLNGGPTHMLDAAGDFRARNEASVGVDGTTAAPGDGYYECFMGRQRLPALEKIPEEVRRRDVEMLLCPSRQVVFRMEPAQFTERPYIPFSILPKPGRFLGTGVCQLLEQIQEEATIHTRQTIDSADLTLVPTLVSSEDTYADYGKRRIYPGAWLPEKTPGDIRPLVWDRNSLNGLELVTYLRNRAQSVISAQGAGQLDQKVRKAAEVQNVMAQTDSKFELYLSNFQRPFKDVGARIVSMNASRMGDMAQQVRSSKGGTKTITAKDLQGNFAYVPTGTSSSATPEVRAKLTQAKMGVQQAYLSALLQATNPMILPLLWHGARQMLLDLAERRPEEWLGPEPTGTADPIAQLQQIIAQLGPQVVVQVLANSQQQMSQGVNLAQGATGALPS